MNPKYSIIFAYRNRDSERVRMSLKSLSNQSNQDFEVVFVDYGSNDAYADKIKSAVEEFDFAFYHYVAHTGLLWNKSKALNYGIKNANSEFVVLADVDVLFAPNFITSLNALRDVNSFNLFKISYLDKSVELKDIDTERLNQLKVSHVGDTFGIGLFPKVALEKVKGLDTFFHFYGSEDEDLNSRLEAAGFSQKRYNEQLLWHQWHPTYSSEKESLTVSPRLSNIKRINQRHFLWHKEEHATEPINAQNWHRVFTKADLDTLNHPDETITLLNIEAYVVHFLRIVMPSYNNQVVSVVFQQDEYYKSLKYKLKNTLNKETQRYISLKEVNDLVLKEIIFKYKDFNYKYEVADDLETISFTIDLNSKP